MKTSYGIKKELEETINENKERTFTCAMCGGVFEPEWSEEDALAELKAEFGDINKEDCDQVCDVCWEKVRPRNNPEFFSEWRDCDGYKIRSRIGNAE